MRVLLSVGEVRREAGATPLVVVGVLTGSIEIVADLIRASDDCIARVRYVQPPRKLRYRYHGACLRRTTRCDGPSRRWPKGNVGKQSNAATGGHAGDGHAAGDCCDSGEKPRSNDTSRIAWAKLMARVGEEFPLVCPACGGDIRLIAFITEPGPIRKILTHLGEPLEPPPVSPARGPPTDWGELVQTHDDGDDLQASRDELPVIDIHSL